MSYPSSTPVSAGETGTIAQYNNLRDDVLYIYNRSILFGGDGSDGALTVTGTPTTIDLGGAAIFVKNYTSISIEGSFSLAFSNPHANGTIVILKSQGDVILTSTTEPNIDVSSLGGAGGASGGSGAGGAGKGYNGSGGLRAVAHGLSSNPRSGGHGGNLNAGSGGNLLAQDANRDVTTATLDGGIGSALSPINQYTLPLPGGGGGGGSAGWNFPTTTSSAGARGGGALYIECNGVLNFTGIIWAKGATADAANGQGGSGAGGSVMILYRDLTSAAGTITVTGGTSASIGQSLVQEIRKSE